MCLFIVPTENYNFGWIFISSLYDYLCTVAVAAAAYLHPQEEGDGKKEKTDRIGKWLFIFFYLRCQRMGKKITFGTIVPNVVNLLFCASTGLRRTTVAAAAAAVVVAHAIYRSLLLVRPLVALQKYAYACIFIHCFFSLPQQSEYIGCF